METYANCLGLAFQIQDDILDIEGNVNNTGKMTHKDQRPGKEHLYQFLVSMKRKEKHILLLNSRVM